MDVETLTGLLREAEEHHGPYEANAPKHHWSGFYAAYIVARDEGRSEEEADQEARRHMDEVLAKQEAGGVSAIEDNLTATSAPSRGLGQSRARSCGVVATRSMERCCSARRAEVNRYGGWSRGKPVVLHYPCVALRDESAPATYRRASVSTGALRLSGAART